MPHQGKIEQDGQRFSIKDKIIVGNQSPEILEKYGSAKFILDAFDKYPNTIGEIDVDTGEKLSFAEMKDQSVRCALWLQTREIGTNDVVCISTPNRINDFVPLFASFFIGAICNPWYYELTIAEAKYFFDLIKPKVMFACEKSIEILEQAAQEADVKCEFIVFGDHPKFQTLKNILSLSTEKEISNFSHVEPENKATQPCVISFSSGTTGRQKGAVLSYQCVLKGRPKYLYLRENMNLLTYSNFFWNTGIFFILLCIKFNCTRIIHKKFDPKKYGHVVEKYKVHWSNLSPTMIAMLCHEKTFHHHDFSSLEVVYTSGSRATVNNLELLRKSLPKTAVLNAFGMTEIGDVAMVQSKLCKKSDSIGYVIENTEVKCIDQRTGLLLGPNEEGELCVRVKTQMLYYLKNLQATKEMIDDKGWLHTGDLGYYDETGEISITGRIKELIKSRNFQISPSEIEAILLKHSGVYDAAVVPVTHEIDVERPLAFVVRNPGSEVTTEELQELPASYNENYRLTGGVTFIEEIPRNTIGKKDVKKLKTLAFAFMNQFSDKSVMHK